MARLLLPLSPAIRFGRLFGRPRFCRTFTFASTGSSCFAPCIWPAITSTSSGLPLPSTRRWNLLPNPARAVLRRGPWVRRDA
jgi:hypothetical protein